ncbi:MAG: hypothetical protein PUI98_07175 [Finegoldia magna]|nr:hypothetical protein [Finegoldia magna]
MEELDEMNANELIQKISKEKTEKEVLNIIFKLKLEGKTGDEIVEKLIEILEKE